MGSRRRFLKAVGIGTVASTLSGHVSATRSKQSGEKSSKRPPKPVERKNIRRVGYHDLDQRPGFKMGISEIDERWYLYIGSLFHSGWTILDVTDPKNPTLENFIEGPPNTWTLQMQAIDGRLVTNAERPADGWQPVEGPRFNPEEGYEAGVGIWDARENPTDPEQVSFFEIEGGTHRNHYDGGDYVYAAGQPEGFDGSILIVIDISDPTNPTEAGRAWWPGQAPDEEFAEGEEGANFHGPAYPDSGDDPEYAYLAYGNLGMVTADISDPENPEFIHRMDYGDVGNTPVANHTAILHPGTNVVWNASEAIFEGLEEEWTYVFALDKEDPESDHVLGPLPTPRPHPHLPYNNYYEKGGRFGPHNTHHYQYNDDYYNPGETDIQAWTWFNAGVRLFDVSDPRAPTEVGYYVPGDPEERLATQPEQTLVTQTEDVLIDSRGYIYITHKNQGVYILTSQLL